MWIRHEQCPQCAERGQDNSQDNLGIHEDGHKYCFSCGYYESKKGVSIDDLTRQFHSTELQQEERKNDSNSLPADISPLISQKALTWLKKYGITNWEIEENQISFSPSRELLIFPIGSKGQHMEAWQGRYFGSNTEHPKYRTKGYKSNVMHIVNPESTTVVLVEDIISAIKVGRQFSAMPLFGSDITKTQLFRLSRYYENICIWLDPDKYQHAIKLGQRAELFFKEVHVVFSEKDPKDFTDEEIKGFISGFHTMELG